MYKWNDTSKAQTLHEDPLIAPESQSFDFLSDWDPQFHSMGTSGDSLTVGRFPSMNNPFALSPRDMLKEEDWDMCQLNEHLTDITLNGNFGFPVIHLSRY